MMSPSFTLSHRFSRIMKPSYRGLFTSEPIKVKRVRTQSETHLDRNPFDLDPIWVRSPLLFDDVTRKHVDRSTKILERFGDVVR